MNEIQDFIQRRFADTDAHWLDGNCYWFSVILCHRFPYLKVYYEPIVGHFYAGTPSHYYDASGLVRPEYCPVLFEEIQKKDELWYEHIVRDCIN